MLVWSWEQGLCRKAVEARDVGSKGCAEEGASRSGDLGFGGQLGDQDTT